VLPFDERSFTASFQAHTQSGEIQCAGPHPMTNSLLNYIYVNIPDAESVPIESNARDDSDGITLVMSRHCDEI
jgi:hypothetical protein